MARAGAVWLPAVAAVALTWPGAAQAQSISFLPSHVSGRPGSVLTLHYTVTNGQPCEVFTSETKWASIGWEEGGQWHADLSLPWVAIDIHDSGDAWQLKPGESFTRPATVHLPLTVPPGDYQGALWCYAWPRPQDPEQWSPDDPEEIHRAIGYFGLTVLPPAVPEGSALGLLLPGLLGPVAGVVRRRLLRA